MIKIPVLIIASITLGLALTILSKFSAVFSPIVK